MGTSYNPMVYKDYLMATEKDVEHVMQQLKDKQEPIMVQFKNVADVTKITLEYVGPHFTKGTHTITGLYNRDYSVPVTISYSDVLTNEVHIITSEGKITRK